MLLLQVPLPKELAEVPAANPVIKDRNGEELVNLPRKDYFRHRPTTLEEIPKELMQATLAAEDKRFLHHGGVDYWATLRAVYDNLRFKRITSGASTITQQLVKISRPLGDRHWAKKIQEFYLARRLETRWSKDEILTTYLNRLDYGAHRQGCVEAARYFFGKPLGDLSLAEAALLAGLPQAPSRLNPYRHPEAALSRRNWILNRMETVFGYQHHLIEQAREEPLVLRNQARGNPIPHLTQRFGGGGRLTIDQKLQSLTGEILKDELARLHQAHAQHGALVVIDHSSGEVLAFHGSSDFEHQNGGQINGAVAPRSAGSSLKPFTYALAIQDLAMFPGTIISDVPTNYRTEEGLEAPKNYDRRHYGPISLREALGRSLNVAAMRVLNELGGPEPLCQLLQKLGLTTIDREPRSYGLGLTIGNAEVSLLELTNAYATIARLGKHLEPRFLLNAPRTRESQVLSPETCYLIADILADNQARAGAFGVHSVLRLPFRCAVKTGTSSDFRDNWCFGFTGHYTVGVWVGNLDNRPMAGISGVAGAGPIFRRTMLALHENREPVFLKRPQGIQSVEVDQRTGHRFLTALDTDGFYRNEELCVQAHLPPPVLSSDYDRDGKALLTEEFSEWFESKENLKRHDFAMKGAPGPASHFPLRILTPMEGATYYLDPELPHQSPELRLVSNLESHQVEWESGSLQIRNGVVSLVVGQHDVCVRNTQTGEKARVRFMVEDL